MASSSPAEEFRAVGTSKALLAYALRSSPVVMTEFATALRQHASEGGVTWVAVSCDADGQTLTIPRGKLDIRLIPLWYTHLLDDEMRPLVPALCPGEVIIRMWSPKALHLGVAFVYSLLELERPLPDAEAYFTELAIQAAELLPHEIRTAVCQHCMQSSASGLQRCSRCKHTLYCNAECQRADWTLHRRECAKLVWMLAHEGWFNPPVH